MNKIREKFVKDWGEELTKKVESAANEHANGVNNVNIGDPFKWALLICIGYECLSAPQCRKYHGIKNLNWSKMKQWIKDNAELKTYKGDLDYLALFTGGYKGFLYD